MEMGTGQIYFPFLWFCITHFLQNPWLTRYLLRQFTISLDAVPRWFYLHYMSDQGLAKCWRLFVSIDNGSSRKHKAQPSNRFEHQRFLGNRHWHVLTAAKWGIRKSTARLMPGNILAASQDYEEREENIKSTVRQGLVMESTEGSCWGEAKQTSEQVIKQMWNRAATDTSMDWNKSHQPISQGWSSQYQGNRMTTDQVNWMVLV